MALSWYWCLVLSWQALAVICYPLDTQNLNNQPGSLWQPGPHPLLPWKQVARHSRSTQPVCGKGFYLYGYDKGNRIKPDAECRPCPFETWSGEDGHQFIKCAPCRPPCNPEREIEAEPCTRVSDRRCACPPGYKEVRAEPELVCIKDPDHIPCKPGQRISSTGIDEVVCVDCPDDTTSFGNNSYCFPHYTITRASTEAGTDHLKGICIALGVVLGIGIIIALAIVCVLKKRRRNHGSARSSSEPRSAGNELIISKGHSILSSQGPYTGSAYPNGSLLNGAIANGDIENAREPNGNFGGGIDVVDNGPRVNSEVVDEQGPAEDQDATDCKRLLELPSSQPEPTIPELPPGDQDEQTTPELPLVGQGEQTPVGLPPGGQCEQTLLELPAGGQGEEEPLLSSPGATPGDVATYVPADSCTRSLNEKQPEAVQIAKGLANLDPNTRSLVEKHTGSVYIVQGDLTVHGPTVHLPHSHSVSHVNVYQKYDITYECAQTEFDQLRQSDHVFYRKYKDLMGNIIVGNDLLTSLIQEHVIISPGESEQFKLPTLTDSDKVALLLGFVSKKGTKKLALFLVALFDAFQEVAVQTIAQGLKEKKEEKKSQSEDYDKIILFLQKLDNDNRCQDVIICMENA